MQRYDGQMNTVQDPFSDLLWEESLEADRRQNCGRQDTPLTSEIENYLKRSA